MSTGTSKSYDLDCAASAFSRLRHRGPRVHCLTNFVAMQLSANLLLAVGAVPSMTMEAAAMPDFVESSASLLVNLGQLDPLRREAAPAAIDTATMLQRPWVLDPVKVDRSGDRRAFAQSLLDRGPAIVRCNTAERPFLNAAAQTVFVVTGELDRIVQADREIQIGGGSPLMDRVTAMGCAGSALAAAFLAVEPDPFVAALSAMLVMKVAGSRTAKVAEGPGSFQMAFLDAVYALEPASLQAEGIVR